MHLPFAVQVEVERMRRDLYRSVTIGMANGQRRGQAYFNGLIDIAPDLAEIVRNTPEDPFSDDSKIPAFLAIIFGGTEQDWRTDVDLRRP